MRFRFYLLPAAVIILGLFFRLYQLEQRAVFDFDQEMAAWWVKNLVADHKISLIGQEISVGGVFIGPFFYYLLTPFYLLTKLYPLGGNIFVSFIALLTMIMIYCFTKRIFNTFSAVITTFLYAIHPGIVGYDRTVAPSNMIIFLSVSLAYFLTKTSKNLWHFLFLGTILGLSFSVHPTAVLLFPITIIYFLIKREKIRIKEFLLIVIPILFLVSPLIFFDLRHNWFIARNVFIAIFLQQGGILFSLITRLFSMIQLLLVFWAGTLISNDSFFIKLPLFILAVWVFFKSSGLVLKLWLLIPLAAMVFYPRHVPEYYFLLLTPIVLIYTVGFLQKTIIGKVLLGIVIFASVVISVSWFKSSDNLLGLYYKNEVVKYLINQANNQPFTVYYSNEPGEAFGFSYLFWWHKAKTVDKMPKKFLIVIPISNGIYHSGENFGKIKVVMLPE